MQTKQNLIFLGGGNMAEAIFATLLTRPQFRITVIQRNPAKRTRLQALYPTLTIKEVLEKKLSADDILILAIKPQHAKEACLSIQNKIKDCLILSVMAGLAISNIQNWTDNSRIIRTMPNTPVSIQKGVTAIYCPPTIVQNEKDIIAQIFCDTGNTYIAKTEAEIDKILPVTSSAIAFVYYFMEGFINNAVEQFGFNPTDARKLVTETFAGSIALVNANPTTTIAELRAKVTSKKGTTEQGILSFERHNLHEIIGEAMQNSFKRGIELAKEFG